MNTILLSIHESAPPFGMDMTTVINAGVSLFNVAILAAALAFLLYRPVRNILHKRTEKIQKQLQLAEEEMTRAMEMRQEYEQKLEEVERERDEILSEARKQATETSRRLLSDAKAEADAVKERAAQNVEMEWERAESEMRTAIIDVSAVMAEKFVKLAINKQTHDSLFEEAVSDLEAMSWKD